MWFRNITVLILLFGFCWLFKPAFCWALSSVKKVKNDFKKTK